MVIIKECERSVFAFSCRCGTNSDLDAAKIGKKEPIVKILPFLDLCPFEKLQLEAWRNEPCR